MKTLTKKMSLIAAGVLVAGGVMAAPNNNNVFPPSPTTGGAYIDQFGSGSVANIIQEGNNYYGYSFQRGTNSTANINQTGNNDKAVAQQSITSLGSTVNITQSGNTDLAYTGQFGGSSFAYLDQYGNGNQTYMYQEAGYNTATTVQHYLTEDNAYAQIQQENGGNTANTWQFGNGPTGDKVDVYQGALATGSAKDIATTNQYFTIEQVNTYQHGANAESTVNQKKSSDRSTDEKLAKDM
jgi:hypothetical protein